MNRPKWKEVEYTKAQIINAGKTIRHGNSTIDELTNATKIIDNWRAAHAFPMVTIYSNLRRMCESNKKVLVAERLKRLDSIICKLKREQHMNLWTMQDLGGCRVIVPNISDVYKYFEQFHKSRIRHILKRTKDYIIEPKSSGYRSFHAVYEYHSDRKDTYNRNMLIEIQFRTHLQHIWATAVETMGLLMNTSIKSGLGSEEVRRFFVLVSALIAKMEGQPLPPGVVDDTERIICEIRELDAKHSFLNLLDGMRVAVDKHSDIAIKKNYAYYILELDYMAKRLHIIAFKAGEIERANELYNIMETDRKEQTIDVVLVRVSSFKSLKKAYPNYFSDIGEFCKIVKMHMIQDTKL